MVANNNYLTYNRTGNATP